MTHTLNGKEVLAVETTKDLIWSFIDNGALVQKREGGDLERRPLPPGQWSILGRGRDLKEEQWQGLVESDWWYDGPKEEHGLGKVTFYREYPKELEDSCLLSATESGLSWLKQQGIGIDLLLIIKN